MSWDPLGHLTQKTSTFLGISVDILCWKAANVVAKRIVQFGRGGGGGGTYYRVRPSKTNFGGLRTWDWSGLCPFPLKKMTGREQTEGGKRIVGGGGGPQTIFGEGFYGMFSLLLSFPPPFVFL